jgi:hypothetical protein
MIDLKAAFEVLSSPIFGKTLKTTVLDLGVKFRADRTEYLSRRTVSDNEFAKIEIITDKPYGEWNHTIKL